VMESIFPRQKFDCLGEKVNNLGNDEPGSAVDGTAQIPRVPVVVR